MPKLFLIDAHALCYRSFFAIKGLSTSKGQATNAVYGFINTLNKILREHKPECMAVCFDSKGKTQRQALYADYKIQRPKMPDELISQIGLIKDVVAAYRLPVLEADGFEADDIIATVARSRRRDEMDVVIVSDDKDMFQLVDDGVAIYNSRKERLIGPADVQELIGVGPEYIGDYIGLAGDSVDNIPGVSGIGGVTARDLISRHGHLEQIFENLNGIKSASVRQKLETQKEQAFLCRRLAQLEERVPLELNPEDLKVREPDYQRLFALFSELEFKRFADDAARHLEPPEEAGGPVLEPLTDVKALAGEIVRAKRFGFICEESEGVVDCAIAAGGEKVFSVSPEQIKGLKAVFADKNILKITHNLKDGLKILKRLGCSWDGEVFDVMLAGYLVSPGKSAPDISSLAWEYLKIVVPATAGAAQKAGYMERLLGPLREQLNAKDLLKLFADIEIPLTFVLSHMEGVGVRLNGGLLADLSRETGKKIDGLERRIYDMAGEEFNLNSPKQLGHILFEKLKLPAVKKTKTGFSTDEGVLTKLAGNHALPGAILEYRQLAKLKSTYIDALPQLVNPRTGRVHATFDQTGTETGRLSSHDPNLQNIPIRTELGRDIRRAFIPSDDRHEIVAADYSQIELRILAHLSGDENLRQAFFEDRDIHRFTSALMFDVAEENVTPEMRNAAKRVNFGIIYGMSAFGLAKDLDVPQDQAQDFIDRYFLRYPGVKKFMDDSVKRCEKDGYVVTLLNRRRYIPEIQSPNQAVRQFAQRQAINTPVQGSAADLMKLAMIRVDRALRERKLESEMMITVHDELVFDALSSETADLVELIRVNMEQALELTVPVKVAVKRGPNWLEAEEIAASAPSRGKR
ncbi:MAG: DNA polymerase I [Candidatus Omnitrophota bacterium]|nr:DNA polymerase I [Candidatus Omnitrophota bacterium]